MLEADGQRRAAVHLGEKAAWNGPDGTAVYARKGKTKGNSGLRPRFQGTTYFPLQCAENIIDAPIHVQKRKSEEGNREAMRPASQMGLRTRRRHVPLPALRRPVLCCHRKELSPPPQRSVLYDEHHLCAGPELTGEVLKVIRSSRFTDHHGNRDS